MAYELPLRLELSSSPQWLLRLASVVLVLSGLWVGFVAGSLPVGMVLVGTGIFLGRAGRPGMRTLQIDAEGILIDELGVQQRYYWQEIDQVLVTTIGNRKYVGLNMKPGAQPKPALNRWSKRAAYGCDFYLPQVAEIEAEELSRLIASLLMQSREE